MSSQQCEVKRLLEETHAWHQPQVSDELPLMVLRAGDAAGRGPLRALHLGFTRVGEAGLEALSQLRGLTALSLEGEGVSGQRLQVCTLFVRVLFGPHLDFVND